MREQICGEENEREKGLLPHYYHDLPTKQPTLERG